MAALTRSKNRRWLNLKKNHRSHCNNAWMDVHIGSAVLSKHGLVSPGIFISKLFLLIRNKIFAMKIFIIFMQIHHQVWCIWGMVKKIKEQRREGIKCARCPTSQVGGERKQGKISIRLVSGGYGKAPNQGDSNADLNNFFFFRLDPCPHVKLNRIKVDWCQIKRCFTLNQGTMSILQFSEIVRFFSVDNTIASDIIEKGENALQSDHLLKFGITKEGQIQAIVRRSYVKDPSKAYHLTVSTL